MGTRTDRALHGPSWAEVIFGAVLSVLLGIVLGAALLILRPVSTVRELPKEPVSGVVYYLEGARDSSKRRQAEAKIKTFIEGQSISLTEQELNALTAAVPQPGAKKEGEAQAETIAAGDPNFRLADGQLQVAVPVTLSFGPKIILQARGTFVKADDMFVFQPETLLVGGCPVERIPFLSAYVRRQIASAQMMPADALAVWKKLANVSIEKNTLKLTLP